MAAIVKLDHVQYQLDETLQGGMGRVMLLSRVDDPPFLERTYRKRLAAKTFLDLDRSASELFERELNIWIGLDAPHCAELLKITRLGGCLHAVMPRYSGSLRARVSQARTLSPGEAQRYIAEAARCLSVVWRTHSVVHLDLKPENLLLDHTAGKPPEVRVSDWGTATVQRHHAATSLNGKTEWSALADTMAGVGTLPYMSPERLLAHVVAPSADIWSLGIMLIEMLTGHLPYRTDKAVDSQITQGDYFYEAERLLASASSMTLARVAVKAVQPHPAARYLTHEELLRALGEPVPPAKKG